MPLALAAVGAATGIYSAVAGADAQRKAANQANDAAKAAAAGTGGGAVNIQQVADQAHQQAVQNALDSAALEKQLNPLAPQLRNDSLQAVIDSLKGGTPYSYQQFAGNPTTSLDPQYQQALTAQFNQSGNYTPPSFNDYAQSGLTKAAYDKAMSDLMLGGKLDQETANQVIRSSAAKAGAVGGRGGGGLGLAHDLSARDLGLTSLQLAQQRLQTANQFGGQTDAFAAQRAQQQNQFGLSAAQLALQQQQQRASLGLGLANLGQQQQQYQLQNWLANAQNYNQYNQGQQQYGLAYNQQQMQNRLAAAGLGQGIQQPVTGLDPSAIANLAVGNSNLAANSAQNAAAVAAQRGNGQSQLGGQLFGMGLGALQQYKPQPSPTTYGAMYGTTGYSING